MTDWCLSWTQASWILMGLAVPPYRLSLAHVGPIWLCWTRGAPVGGWRALGFSGSANISTPAHLCWAPWGPVSSCEKAKCVHLMGSPFDVFPALRRFLCSYPVFFMWSVIFLWITVSFLSSSDMCCFTLSPGWSHTVTRTSLRMTWMFV